MSENGSNGHGATEVEKRTASGIAEAQRSLGHAGLKQAGGRVREEFLRHLVGKRGIATYTEMRDNDPINSAVFHAVEMLIRSVDWWDEGAEGPDAEEANEFATQCRSDMADTWTETIAEWLSMLQYGWCYAEMVFKERLGENEDDPEASSRFDDGRMGIRSLYPVGQDTLDRWEWKGTNLLGMWQTVLSGENAGPHFIPYEKALLFRTQTRKRNPEGRSILRGAYRPWYFKKRMEEIEAIGVERDLAGLPQLQPPEDGPNIWDPNDPIARAMLRAAEDLVRGIRRDEKEGVVIPPGWTFLLTSTGGQRQLDVGKIIERLARWQAMVVLADVILLGHEKVGSLALADAKTNLLGVSLAAWLDVFAEVVNRRLYPMLFRLNGFRLTKIPELRHGDVESPDLAALGAYVGQMAGIGAITLDETLEQYLRTAANLPPKPEEDPDEDAGDDDPADDPVDGPLEDPAA